jgi:hypothetical protein
LRGGPTSPTHSIQAGSSSGEPHLVVSRVIVELCGRAEVLTYEPEELLGTKLRALYQRKKGRDLFDLSEAFTRLKSIDPEKVVACFLAYLETEGRRVTRAQFERNLASKIRDKVFLSDVPPLLARGASFDPRGALDRVREAFISRIPEGASSRKRGGNASTEALTDRFGHTKID